jgi:hypothetical protein
LPFTTNAGTGGPITNLVPLDLSLAQRFFRYSIK